MRDTTDRFIKQVRAEILRRGLTQTQVALLIGESVVSLNHMLNGYRPHKRLRAKVAHFLSLPGNLRRTDGATGS